MVNMNSPSWRKSSHSMSNGNCVEVTRLTTATEAADLDVSAQA